MRSLLVVTAVALSSCAGCASVSVRHVSNGDKSEGIHFYRPRPYLLISKQTKVASQKVTTEQVKSDPVDDATTVDKAPKVTEKTVSTKGATSVAKTTTETSPISVEYSSRIIYLPDRSQEYTVEMHPGIGTANGTVKLTDGWMLTEFAGTTDSKISDLVSTAATLAGTVIAAAAAAAAPAEGLYRIDIAEDGSVTLQKQAW